MTSASTPSANEPVKDLILVHTVQLRPIIKHISQEQRYSRHQYNVSVPFKKTVVLQHPNVFKTVTVYRFYGVYTLTILTRHFPSNSSQIHQ